MKKLIMYWHSKLDMPKYDLDWHKKDIEDELQELKEAEGFVAKWSEISDVVYSCTRAQWSGHEDIKFPLKNRHFYFGILYMIPKISLRWKFYRVIGKSFDKNLKITAVRNPKKIEKLNGIAEKYELDPDIFRERVEKLMKKWIFLK